MHNKNFGIAGLVFFITVCACNAISSFQKSFPAVIAFDIQSDINISLENLALISSFTFLTYGLAQIPIGILTDKLGGKKVLWILQFFCGIFTLIFAFSSNSFFSLGSRFMIGFLITSAVPGLKIVATHYPGHLFSRLSSFVLAAGTCGAIFAATPLVFMKDLIGWRFSIAAIGCLSIICALILFFSPQKDEIVESKSEPISILTNLKNIFFNKAFIPIFLWFAFVPGTLFTFGGYWLGPYLIQGAKMTQMHTSTLIFLSAIFSTLCMPFFPIISEKIIKSHKKTMIISSFMYLILFLPYLFLSEINYAVMLVMYTALCTFATGSIPLAFALCKENVEANCFGAASGALNMAGPIFASLFQIIFAHILAYVAGNNSMNIEYYAHSFIFIAILALCGFISTLFIKSRVS